MSSELEIKRKRIKKLEFRLSEYNLNRDKNAYHIKSVEKELRMERAALLKLEKETKT